MTGVKSLQEIRGRRPATGRSFPLSVAGSIAAEKACLLLGQEFRHLACLMPRGLHGEALAMLTGTLTGGQLADPAAAACPPDNGRPGRWGQSALE